LWTGGRASVKRCFSEEELKVKENCIPNNSQVSLRETQSNIPEIDIVPPNNLINNSLTNSVVV